MIPETNLRTTAAPVVEAIPLKPLFPSEQLVEEVYQAIGAPVDRWAVVATLESLGVREADVQREYGAQNLPELADDIFALCRQRGVSPPRRKKKRKPVPPLVVRFFIHYGQGLLYTLPIVGQLALFLLLGFSLYSWLGFSEREATAITLGAIFSYILTGGFVQAISRCGEGYVENEQYHLARAFANRILRLATIGILLTGVCLAVFNCLTPILDSRQLLIFLFYYVLLSELWLIIALLYLFRQHLLVTVFILAGTAVTVLVFLVFKWSIFWAHGLGVTATLLLGYGHVRRVMDDRVGQVTGRSPVAALPRNSIMAFTAAPYFAYGLLYFAFLFLDRLIAWTAVRDLFPAVVWFRPWYEIGVDLALIPLVLITPALEHPIREFALRLVPRQEKTSGFSLAEFNADFRRFYARQFGLMATLILVSLIVAYGLIFGAAFLAATPPEFLTNRTVLFVFALGAFGYAALTVGVFNTTLHLALNQAGRILRLLGLAFAVHAAAGYLMSRIFGYEYAILGMAAGAFVFALLSTRAAWRLMDSLDYYYYAAY